MDDVRQLLCACGVGQGRKVTAELSAQPYLSLYSCAVHLTFFCIFLRAMRANVQRRLCKRAAAARAGVGVGGGRAQRRAEGMAGTAGHRLVCRPCCAFGRGQAEVGLLWLMQIRVLLCGRCAVHHH